MESADAAPEQVNSFGQSKMEVFEKIEESLGARCMVEDLNDDEIMEFCIISNASCATRLGLREGFAVDLTTARANGTIWDLSHEDNRAELRRVQNREQPELLAGSPPGDDFSSLLNTCVESRSHFGSRAISCSHVHGVFPVHERFWFCLVQVSATQFCCFPPVLMARASDGSDVPVSP